MTYQGHVLSKNIPRTHVVLKARTYAKAGGTRYRLTSKGFLLMLMFCIPIDIFWRTEELLEYDGTLHYVEGMQN